MRFLFFILFFIFSVFSTDAETCRGAFDVYFVLDKSRSLEVKNENKFKKETVPFTEELLNSFTSSLMRTSFITFNDEAQTVMPLTSNKLAIKRKLTEMKMIIPFGRSYLNYGLEKVLEQITKFGNKRASVVIILTDGKIVSSSFVQAKKLRELGVTILAIGVALEDYSQLLHLAGGDKNSVFLAKSFNTLKFLTQKIIRSACVEIISVSPNPLCAKEGLPSKFKVWGKGFNKTGHVLCGLRFNSTEKVLIKPIYVSDEYLVFPVPFGDTMHVKKDENVTIQVSLNKGLTFVTSNITVTIQECHDYGLAVLYTVIPLALFLIWWFWKALCCCYLKKPETPQPEEPPVPEAPKPLPVGKKQWPTVDCSMYGGRGIGGIAPLKVNWGDKGCTEAGIFLERAKGAKEVGFVEKEVLVEEEDDENYEKLIEQNSCCEKLKRYLLRAFHRLRDFYKRISIRRPDKKDIRSCSCWKSL